MGQHPGEELASAAIGQGLSQDALAGVFQKLIRGIENDRANPELDTLGKYADAVGVHPRELLEE